MRGRRYLYDARWLSGPACGVPVLSVGGLEAGGSGKTPVVAWLLRQLLAAGRHPGLLTRGYGRPHSTLQVRARGDACTPTQLGDEAAMLVHSGLDVPVAACPSRARGAAALLGHACDCLVLDDGFAHRRLPRQLDLVVLRAEAPFANGALLPAGPLREPPDSLRRAQVVWLHHKGPPATRPTAVSWQAALCPQACMVYSQQTSAGAFDGQGRAQNLRGRAVLAVAGIARPSDFLRSLQAQGAKPVDFVALPDHHVYDGNQAQALARRLQQLGAQALLTTAKDAIKLAPLWPKNHGLWVLQDSLSITAGAARLRDLVLSTVGD